MKQIEHQLSFIDIHSTWKYFFVLFCFVWFSIVFYFFAFKPFSKICLFIDNTFFFFSSRSSSSSSSQFVYQRFCFFRIELNWNGMTWNKQNKTKQNKFFGWSKIILFSLSVKKMLISILLFGNSAIEDIPKEEREKKSIGHHWKKAFFLHHGHDDHYQSNWIWIWIEWSTLYHPH